LFFSTTHNRLTLQTDSAKVFQIEQGHSKEFVMSFRDILKHMCFSVGNWTSCEKPLGLIAVGFDLGRCQHCAGECRESGSYRQEKVTEALQAALWQAWWDD